MAVFSKRPKPNLSFESSLGFFASNALVIGVDEVGRGCLAGPVVAAAAIIHPESVSAFGFSGAGKRPGGRRRSPLFDVRDSKLIPEAERGPLAEFVRSFVHGYAVGEASVAEIERLNIYHAAHLAMERAVLRLEESLGREAHAILIDGNAIPKSLRYRSQIRAIIKGDNRSLSIACAALIAKVHRDSMMPELERLYPGYGFLSHKGYGTPFHLQKLKELGVIDQVHRRGFQGVPSDQELDFDAWVLGQEQDLFISDPSESLETSSTDSETYP